MNQRISVTVLILGLAAGCGGNSAGPSPSPDGASAASDGAPAADGITDGAAGPDVTLGPPVVMALSPTVGIRGAKVVLVVSGSGFGNDSTVHFDGQPVPTTRQSASQLSGELSAELTAQAGFHTVWAQNGPPAAERSNLVYFSVEGPVGSPEVLDYKPDNGLPGDTVRLVGFNLTGEPLMIKDPKGHAAAGGAIGIVNSPTAVLESVEFVVPAGWETGPLTIAASTGSFRGKVFNVGRNLARLPGATATASTEYGGEWTIARGADNDLYTSWFSAAGDCVTEPAPTCKTTPWFMISFPAPQTVTRIALRGNREYTSGYDFVRGRFEVLGAAGAVLWSGSYDLPEPDRDLDLLLPTPVPEATSVRFTSEKDESEDPGLGELEIF
jgi:hypothetical protein